ncbi:MAG TPA: FkbM family methyltransferase [Methylomirabilota bacterium]|nr:FkbM family methyltransferase [Methylomirabilota bacterium]
MLRLLKRLFPASLRGTLRERLNSVAVIDECELAREVFNWAGRRGTMFDVGAHRGHTCGPFAAEGWRVHAFEPDPENYQALKASIAHMAHVVAHQVAVTEQSAAALTLHRSSTNSYIGSLSAFDSSHSEGVTVTAVSLTDFCDREGIERVDFLKVDAEGHDWFVLRGFPWSRIQPEVVLCEFEDRKTRPLGYTWEEMAEDLVGRGYTVLVSEWAPIVSYQGPFKWRRCVPYPSELLDQDANGNLVAFRNTRWAGKFMKLAQRKHRWIQLLSRMRRLAE